tara:strand:+ start:625 stop:978 length:354 start_codon:yes stop_codon:yes gene_type:complete
MVNKQQIIKKFKGVNQFKSTFLNYKTNKDIKEEFKQNILNSFVDEKGNKLKEEDFYKHLEEDNKTFSFKNISIFKNFRSKMEILNKLPYDIKTNTIKEYDNIKGNWFKTELCLYELI